MKLWMNFYPTTILICFLCLNVEYIRDLLKNGITSAISLFTHVYTLQHYHFPKWFTGDIQHQINCLHTLRRKKPTASHLIKSEGMESKLQEDIAIAKGWLWIRSGFWISCSNTSTIFQNHNDLPTPQRSSNTTTIFQHHNNLSTQSLCLYSNMWQLYPSILMLPQMDDFFFSVYLQNSPQPLPVTQSQSILGTLNWLFQMCHAPMWSGPSFLLVFL